MTVKLTHHGGHIKIFYSVTNAPHPHVHLDNVQESNWTVDNLIYHTTLAKILGICYTNV